MQIDDVKKIMLPSQECLFIFMLFLKFCSEKLSLIHICSFSEIFDILDVIYSEKYSSIFWPHPMNHSALKMENSATAKVHDHLKRLKSINIFEL